MGLAKAKGNMYPWVTHLWNPISGPCPHQCSYCYVQSMRRVKQPAELTLNEPFPALGKDKTIFVGHMIDMFAGGICEVHVCKVLDYCIFDYPYNVFVFQSKNPGGMLQYEFPENSIFGTTIETNRDRILEKFSKAPSTYSRMMNLNRIKHQQNTKCKTFITVEPIIDFHVELLTAYLIEAKPDFINIGADSKGHNLPEPPQAKIGELIAALKEAGIEVRLKENLKRLFPW